MLWIVGVILCVEFFRTEEAAAWCVVDGVACWRAEFVESDEEIVVEGFFRIAEDVEAEGPDGDVCRDEQ